jgi:hypothetical protein
LSGNGLRGIGRSVKNIRLGALLSPVVVLVPDVEVKAPPELLTFDVGVEPTLEVGAALDVVLVPDAPDAGDVPAVLLGPVVEAVPDMDDVWCVVTSRRVALWLKPMSRPLVV